MRFWIYCHGCQEGAELELTDTWVFMCRHSGHAPVLTRIRLDQIETAEKNIVEGAEALLEANK